MLVATISKLFKGLRFSGDVLLNPTRRHIGAAMSNNIIPITNGRSFFKLLFYS